MTDAHEPHRPGMPGTGPPTPPFNARRYQGPLCDVSHSAEAFQDVPNNGVLGIFRR